MTEKEIAYKEIEKLVNRFAEQETFYKQPTYNETETRRDFIDPFFNALGWDIDNKKGLLLTEREVSHERSVDTTKGKKTADYSFNFNGKILFYVEAKKPAIPLRIDPKPAFQLRNYGWNSNLNISILTDFEEFSIYDCTKKSKTTDKASKGRIKFIYYKDYLKEFDFIWETFSHSAVINGSLDQFIKKNINEREKETVDKEFLKSLENWRTYLATNIALNNKHLDEDEINFSVQQTIDRIVFLKICEDREVEKEGTLKSCLKKGNYYQNLFEHFKTADQKYNSGIFDFKKDTLTANITIENKIIKNIIADFDDIGYDFSKIPIEILGYAYEQFLGKIIRLEKSGHAVIETKPEVRKAGGVYYTPEYIVNYIVKNTVGKLIEHKTPEEISKIKILDPACGSGSFLLGAYQFLLNYHQNYYIKKYKGKITKDSPINQDGSLKTSEKKKILVNNIFGLDIDTQAVEVTKLSLLIKAMEGETTSTIETTLRLFHERVLPNLDNNIQSGNSLVNSDFYDAVLDLESKQERKINVFNWKKRFSQIDGFDIIIGNPPYRTLQLGKKQASEMDYLLEYYKTHFPYSFDYKINLFALFIEKCISIIAENGIFSMIVPSAFYNSQSYSKLREYLLKNGNFSILCDLRYKVFEQAEIGGNAIFFFSRNLNEKNIQFHSIDSYSEFYKPQIQNIQKENISKETGFNLNIDTNYIKIINKIAQLETVELGSITKIYQGIITGDNKKFLSDKPINDKWKKILRGRDINKYSIIFDNNYVLYEPELLWSNTNLTMFDVPEKIISRQTSDKLVAAIDSEHFFSLDSTHVIHLKTDKISLKYLLAVYNSKLINFIYQSRVKEIGRVFAQVKVINIKPLPIKLIDKNNKNENDLYNDIENLVDRIMVTNKEIQKKKIQHDKDVLLEKIEHLTNEIDRRIYKLYNIQQDEINIIEQLCH